ncbi:uncharacterized protein [Patagioenas fasciata]|uniref:uncharacterized protein n=1 Tax=Patagioenas fasciata TaxID=372321 RepID=UPI0032E896EA
MLDRQTVPVRHCQGCARGFGETDGPSQVTQEGRTLLICVGCPGGGHHDSHRGCRDVSPHIPPGTPTAVCWDPLHLSRALLPPTLYLSPANTPQSRAPTLPPVLIRPAGRVVAGLFRFRHHFGATGSATAMENIARMTIGAAVGAGLLLVGIPLAIGALGFTSAGIAAGSVAAKMMSAAAIANGGGVAAGSTVAVLQSIGAAGMSLGAKIGLGTLGSAAGAKLFKKNSPK